MTLNDPYLQFQDHAILWRWISQKQYDIQTWCHWNTNRDLRTPYATVSFRMTLSDLAKYSMTRSFALSLCDSWASCCYLRECVSCALRIVCDGSEQRVPGGEGLRQVRNAPAVEVHSPRGAVQHVESLLRHTRDWPRRQRTCWPPDRHGAGLQQLFQQLAQRRLAVPLVAVYCQLSHGHYCNVVRLTCRLTIGRWMTG